MGLLGWWIIIGGPLACAFAGALVAWLFTRRHYELRLDRVYEDGWRAGRQWYPAEAVTLAAPPAALPSAEPTRPLRVSVAASGALLALPAPPGEGGRHERPHRPAWRHDDLAALARVRDQFDRIREDLGLPARS